MTRPQRTTALGWTAVLALLAGTTACGSRVDASEAALPGVRVQGGAGAQALPARPPMTLPQQLTATDRQVVPAPVVEGPPADTAGDALDAAGSTSNGARAGSSSASAPTRRPVGSGTTGTTGTRDAADAGVANAPAAAPRRTAAAPRPLATEPTVLRLGRDGRPVAVRQIRPTRTAAPADRYALLVGVQHYRSPTRDTIASVGDIALIKRTLLASGWRAKNIKVLVDDQATGNNIRAGMNWLQARSRPGKTFSFFHYSGHVKMFGNRNEALWPIDRDWIRDRELATQLAQVRGRMWVDIAGCEAGSFAPGLVSRRVLFTGSSTAVQKSYEHPGWGTSVWTGLMFKLAPRQADANRDGEVVVGEALRYSRHFAQVVTRVQRPHGKQTPVVLGDPVRGWTLEAPPR